MKNKSVKTQITILLTLLMAALAILLLVFMLFISNSVATQTSKRQLTDIVRSNVSYIEVHEKKPTIAADFSYYHNGITTLVYSQSEALIAGQIPVSFQAELPFENGSIRKVSSGENDYLVLDLFLSESWNHGVWLRGLTEAPNSEALTRNLLLIALIALPLFISLAALGSYHITRRSFRPLEHITATAEAINEAKDLSGRIGLPPGEMNFPDWQLILIRCLNDWSDPLRPKNNLLLMLPMNCVLRFLLSKAPVNMQKNMMKHLKIMRKQFP